jgi:hypothetical protein
MKKLTNYLALALFAFFAMSCSKSSEVLAPKVNLDDLYKTWSVSSSTIKTDQKSLPVSVTVSEEFFGGSLSFSKDGTYSSTDASNKKTTGKWKIANNILSLIPTGVAAEDSKDFDILSLSGTGMEFGTVKTDLTKILKDGTTFLELDDALDDRENLIKLYNKRELDSIITSFLFSVYSDKYYGGSIDILKEPKMKSIQTIITLKGK